MTALFAIDNSPRNGSNHLVLHSTVGQTAACLSTISQARNPSNH